MRIIKIKPQTGTVFALLWSLLIYGEVHMYILLFGETLRELTPLLEKRLYRVAAINPDFFLVSFKWLSTAENQPILLK
jgi:hypothetical protein